MGCWGCTCWLPSCDQTGMTWCCEGGCHMEFADKTAGEMTRNWARITVNCLMVKNKFILLEVSSVMRESCVMPIWTGFIICHRNKNPSWWDMGPRQSLTGRRPSCGWERGITEGSGLRHRLRATSTLVMAEDRTVGENNPGRKCLAKREEGWNFDR